METESQIEPGVFWDLTIHQFMLLLSGAAAMAIVKHHHQQTLARFLQGKGL